MEAGHCVGLGWHVSETLIVAWNFTNRISLAAASLVIVGLTSCQPINDARQSIENSLSPKSAGPPPLVLKDEPDLRVRILSSVRQITIDGPTRVVVRTNQGTAPVSIPCPITITSGGRGIAIKDAKGLMRNWSLGIDVEVVASDARTTIGGASLPGTTLLRVDDVSFPGFISIRPHWQDYPDQFDVIASMGVEGYLPAALAAEMSPAWPRQALEAQAVVLRTQALGEMRSAQRSLKQFDVESSLEQQRTLTGYGISQAMEAVRQTRGLALTSGGRLLRAYSCPTCGGRSASAVDAFGSTYGTEYNSAAPLIAKPREYACERSPDYRWEVERRDEELSQRIRAWGIQYTSAVASMTRVREIRIEQLNAAKRPSKFRIIDNSSREFVLSAEDFRNACNQNVMGQAPIDNATRLRSGDVEVEIWANIVKFRGRGAGHGVGLCQQCAKGFADEGWDWRRMMTKFYPGADLTKMY